MAKETITEKERAEFVKTLTEAEKADLARPNGDQNAARIFRMKKNRLSSVDRLALEWPWLLHDVFSAPKKGQRR